MVVGKNIWKEVIVINMKSSKTIDFESIFEFSRKEVDKQKHYYDTVALKNTEKVIAAFRKHQVSDFYMKPSTGYA